MSDKRLGYVIDLDAMKASIRVIVVIGNRNGHSTGLAMEYHLLEHFFFHLLSTDLRPGQRKFAVGELKTQREFATGISKLFDMLGLFIKEIKAG